MRDAAVLARQARQRDHESGHEEESRRDRHAGESCQELQNPAEHRSRPGRQFFGSTPGIEHQRGMIQRHVRDQQAAKHVDIGLARAAGADSRARLDVRSGGRVLRHGHMIGKRHATGHCAPPGSATDKRQLTDGLRNRRERSPGEIPRESEVITCPSRSASRADTGNPESRRTALPRRAHRGRARARRRCRRTVRRRRTWESPWRAGRRCRSHRCP